MERASLALRLGGLLVAMSFALSGCTPLVRELPPSGPRLEIEAYSVAARAFPAQLLAGVATIDITPPPGYPTGGHGPIGQVALGYWTRLKARAFFFESSSGRVVLVSTDLYAVSGGLHDLVVKRVAELAHGKGCSGITPATLIIAATHTHQGPANYMTAKTYNQHGGFYPGFDPQLLEFLTQRLAAVVCKAVEKAVESSLESRRFTLAGDPPFLNRSPTSFLVNANAVSMMEEFHPGQPNACQPKPGEPATEWELDGCPRLRAVNREVRLLRIWQQGKPAGTLVFFAAHPTVLVHDAPINSSDFVGWAMNALELDSSANAGSVVGFFNGAEGDITARRTSRGLREVADFGRIVRDQIKGQLARGAPTMMADPRVLLNHAAVAASQATCLEGERAWRLAREPMFGAAALGGAEGDRTVLHDLGWRRGVRDRPRASQGVKLGALDSQLERSLKLTAALAPPVSFPRTLPLTGGKIGDFEFVTVPAELNTSVGYAIRNDLSSGSEAPVIIGLADEYVSYVASSDEYPAQDYMAASTMWGPEEADFIRCRLKYLPRTDWTELRVPKAIYWPGPKAKEKFGPPFVAQSPSTKPKEIEPEARRYLDDGLDEILLGPNGNPDRSLPQFRWREEVWDAEDEDSCALTSSRANQEGDFCAALRRRVTIEVLEHGVWKVRETSGGWPDSDYGMNFLTQAWSADRTATEREYGAIWLAPIMEEGQPVGTEFRFRVHLRDSPVKTSEICSDKFTLGSGSGRILVKEAEC